MKLELARSYQKSPTDVDHNFTVLLAGRNRTGLDQLVDIVSRIKGINITTNHICNGHSDPLHGVDTLPQLLVFWIGENWRVELGELVQRSAKQRPATIVPQICRSGKTLPLWRTANLLFLLLYFINYFS